MPDESAPAAPQPDLTEAFTSAYPVYVGARLAELGLPEPAGLADAVDAGAAHLRNALDELMAIPPALQRRTPLELFQEALEFPTRVLAAAGVTEADRDPVAEAALPGDRYDLAPASSRVLGDAAWRAHVAWGIAKAEAVAGMVPAPSSSAGPGTDTVLPLVALVGVDLMDRTRIEPVVKSHGYGFVAWRNPAAIEAGLEGTPPAVVLVDLTHASALDAIRTCTGEGVRTIAFGPHVDDVGLARARSLGAVDAVPRSRFFAKLGEYLDAIV